MASRLVGVPEASTRPARLVFFPATRTARNRALTVEGATRKDEDDPSATHLTFPPEPFVVRDLQLELQDVGGLDLSGSVAQWFGMHKRFAQRSIDIAHWEGGDVPPDVDPTAWNRLYPYQRTAARWLRYVRRGILGDEMGLGKTATSLVATAGAARILVVTVPMAERTVWERHVEDWLHRPAWVASGTSLRRASLIESAAHEDRVVLVINHEMFQKRWRASYRPLFERKWDVVIFDEAHKFQSHNSEQSKGAEAVATDRLYLLTGTPVWNRPDSIYQLLRLIDPVRWTSYWRFVDVYCQTIDNGFAREITGLKPGSEERLRNLVAPFLVQRKKKDVLPDLPDKVVQTIEYDLEPAQRKAYVQLKKQFRIDTADKTYMAGSIPKKFADMRRLCNAPELIEGLKIPSAKDKVLDQLLEEATSEGKKVVIFTWHNDYCLYLTARLSQDYATRMISGETPVNGREANWRWFRDDPDAQLMVCTIATTGVAIEFTAASVAIFAEGSYVWTQDAQAEDRLHRIGQKCDVTIYRLAATRTIEQAIWETVEQRASETNEMLAFRSVVERMLAQED